MDRPFTIEIFFDFYDGVHLQIVLGLHPLKKKYYDVNFFYGLVKGVGWRKGLAWLKTLEMLKTPRFHKITRTFESQPSLKSPQI